MMGQNGKGEIMAKSECCHNCVYACRDMCQAMASFATGFAYRPKCANQPGHYGQMRPALIGKICSNFRERPPAPSGDVKPILLTDGIYAYVSACDYEEISKYNWRLVGGGYAGRKEGNKTVLMHRQIMKPPRGKVIDHIHGNRLDNSRENMRICSRRENSHNKAKHRGSASRFKGVYYNKRRGRWYAAIYFDGRMHHLGYFDDEIKAARAYDRAAVEQFGEFARLNFPEEWKGEGKRKKAKSKRKRAGKTTGR
jgi:hypothetical protein